MRLAGYDWVPETKLMRSLRESWQQGRAGRSQNVRWLPRVHAMCDMLFTLSGTAALATDRQGLRRFWGLYV